MNTTIEDQADLGLKSDKELLEDFLNSLELDNKEIIEGDSSSPEIRVNTFLWVIKQKEIELDKCRKIAEESINKTNEWLATKESRIQNAIQYLSIQMGNFLRSQNLKSLSLPNGSIGFRKQQDSLRVVNEELFLSKANPELLRHSPEAYEPDIKAIKSYIKKTSDIPEGIEIIPQDPKFYYKLEEDQ